MMSNALITAPTLRAVRNDLDEAAHALANYNTTKSDAEALAWLATAAEALTHAVTSLSIAVERLAELPQCDGSH